MRAQRSAAVLLLLALPSSGFGQSAEPKAPPQIPAALRVTFGPTSLVPLVDSSSAPSSLVGLRLHMPLDAARSRLAERPPACEESRPQAAFRKPDWFGPRRTSSTHDTSKGWNAFGELLNVFLDDRASQLAHERAGASAGDRHRQRARTRLAARQKASVPLTGHLASAPNWRLALRDTKNYLQAQVATRVGGVYCPSLFVHYGVNSACNLRCSYCFIHEPETFPKGFSEVGLPLEEAKRVLDHAREEAMFLRFMGGAEARRGGMPR